MILKQGIDTESILLRALQKHGLKLELFLKKYLPILFLQPFFKNTAVSFFKLPVAEDNISG